MTTNISCRRVKGIVRKELKEYRRNRQVVATMVILPLLFCASPLIQIFALTAASAPMVSHGYGLLYLLGIPALVPAALAAYSVVGERQQGTLEPVLSTPIRREEFLLGKALAALIPSLAVSYGVYAFVIASVEFFAQPAVASALLRGPEFVAQIVFTPLLAAWSIWLGIAVSTRSSDLRVAQQLGMLANVPSVVVTSLIAYNVIHASFGLAIGAAAVLVLLARFGWRIASAMLDRERLIAGAR
jgi:ABC-2 type transport system permease protein